MKTLYFAYGSNINPERMRIRKADFSKRSFGRLKNYKLVFNLKSRNNPDEGFANIVQDENSCVEGAVYETTQDAIHALDRFEGYPKLYRREIVRLELQDGEIVEAFVYVANENHTKDGLKPSREYLSHLLCGNDILSDEYYRQLESTDTVD